MRSPSWSEKVQLFLYKDLGGDDVIDMSGVSVYVHISLANMRAQTKVVSSVC